MGRGKGTSPHPRLFRPVRQEPLPLPSCLDNPDHELLKGSVSAKAVENERERYGHGGRQGGREGEGERIREEDSAGISQAGQPD